MILTTKGLRRKGACADQRDLFHNHTGGSIDITEAWCTEHAAKFDWDWAANNLLTAPARADYERVRAAAWADYERVRAAAEADYERVRALAWARAYNSQDTQP